MIPILDVKTNRGITLIRLFRAPLKRKDLDLKCIISCIQGVTSCYKSMEWV